MILNDEDFVVYWQKNSQKEKKSTKSFMLGLSSGIAIGVCVILTIYSGWYQRATMVAYSKMSGLILFLAIILIAVFIAFVYRQFKWETQEQRYLEIISKQSTINSAK